MFTKIRISLERFCSNLSDDSEKGIGYKLYSFGGTRTFFSAGSLRNGATNGREVFSDVFIFEKSDRSEYYTLVITKQDFNKQKVPDSVKFHLCVMSFCKIDVVEIPFPVMHQREFLTQTITDAEFGGSFQNPNYLNNPMAIVDVTVQMSFQFKVEFSDPTASLMICLVGIDLENDDPRAVNYSYWLKQANPGTYSKGVSELNCLLEVGRYMLVTTIQKGERSSGILKVQVGSYLDKMSDHPMASEKVQANERKAFTLKAVEKAKLEARLPIKFVHRGEWPAKRNSASLIYSTPAYGEFQKNPGVIVSPKTTTRVRFHLRSIGYQKNYEKALATEFRYHLREPPGVSVCVMKINGLNDIRPIEEREELSQGSWGFWSK